MTIKEIKDILKADILTGEDKLLEDCRSACGCDLMSDVLAFSKQRMALLTGLTNAHVVRTSEMLDVLVIIFVRGKKPAEDVISLAKEKGIAVLTTNYTLFEACGLLYAKGLSG